jgi:hypothetical protein
VPAAVKSVPAGYDESGHDHKKWDDVAHGHTESGVGEDERSYGKGQEQAHCREKRRFVETGHGFFII